MFYSKKSQQELKVIKKFIGQFNDFPQGRLVKTESPDFIVKTGIKSSVGIELTRLRPPDNIKKSYEMNELVLSKEILEQTIKGKEIKLGLYRRKRLNQIWLIISGEQAMDTSRFNISNKLQNWSFQSEFHRIFFFDPAGSGIFELNISDES